jgi:hypothetical protein
MAIETSLKNVVRWEENVRSRICWKNIEDENAMPNKARTTGRMRGSGTTE